MSRGVRCRRRVSKDGMLLQNSFATYSSRISSSALNKERAKSQHTAKSQKSMLSVHIKVIEGERVDLAEDVI